MDVIATAGGGRDHCGGGSQEQPLLYICADCASAAGVSAPGCASNITAPEEIGIPSTMW